MESLVGVGGAHLAPPTTRVLNAQRDRSSVKVASDVTSTRATRALSHKFCSSSSHRGLPQSCMSASFVVPERSNCSRRGVSVGSTRSTRGNELRLRRTSFPPSSTDGLQFLDVDQSSVRRNGGSAISSVSEDQNIAESVDDPLPSPVAVQSSNSTRKGDKTADWKKAEKLKDTGAVHRGRVDSCNSGGLLVRIGSLQGFLPFSHLNGARIPKDGSKTISEIGNELVGDLVSVKVIECLESERRLIVSEKQAVLVDIIQQIQEGNIYQGKVNFVTDYGAFVDLEFPDGSYPVSGLVHVTELSWDPVPFPQDFIAQGQEVTVKVIQVDREKSKLALSVKQLQADPLLETLDTLMPSQEEASRTETDNPDAELIGTSLPGLEQICDYMLQEEGISGVTLGRQALERRVVSQDLELWLSNASAEDGKFTLLARAGRQVQEVYLNTSLDREGIKAAVQRVTGRVP